MSVSEESDIASKFGFQPLINVNTVVPVVSKFVSNKHDLSNKSVKLKKFKHVLDSIIRENLSQIGIKKLFPIQAQIIPQILNARLYETDFCVCSPTGTGKTLTYMIPVVQRLMNRVVCRVRAVVLVPTKPLINQIKDTFDLVAKGTGLKVFAFHQNKLVEEQEHFSQVATPEGLPYDVLISTPQRLADHLEKSKSFGFSLEHLRYLIIDEADRVLANELESRLVVRILNACKQSDQARQNPSPEPLLKMLFSATLTNNPAKLEEIGLINPQFFAPSDGSSFVLPSQLNQFKVECDEEAKPLALISLLKKYEIQSCLCFASNKEATRRLCVLLQQFYNEENDSSFKVEEFSNVLPAHRLKEIIEEFNQGIINMIICSDLMARGLDLQVENVVNYDVPAHVKTYLHRCGRTARAGRTGNSYTLVSREQVPDFEQMMAKVEGPSVANINLSTEDQLPYTKTYENAFAKMRELELGRKRKRTK